MSKAGKVDPYEPGITVATGSCHRFREGDGVSVYLLGTRISPQQQCYHGIYPLVRTCKQP